MVCLSFCQVAAKLIQALTAATRIVEVGGNLGGGWTVESIRDVAVQKRSISPNAWTGTVAQQFGKLLQAMLRARASRASSITDLPNALRESADGKSADVAYDATGSEAEEHEEHEELDGYMLLPCLDLTILKMILEDLMPTVRRSVPEMWYRRCGR